MKNWIAKHRTETILALVAIILIIVQQLFFPLVPRVERIINEVTDFQVVGSSQLRYYSRDTAQITEVELPSLREAKSSEEFNGIKRIWWNITGEQFVATFENTQPAAAANPLFIFERPLNTIQSVIYSLKDGTLIVLPRVVNEAIWLTPTRLIYHGEGLNERAIYSFDIPTKRESAVTTLAESGVINFALQPNGNLALVQNKRLLRYSEDLKTSQETKLPYNATSLTFLDNVNIIVGVQRKSDRPAIARGNLEKNKFTVMLLRGMPKRGSISSIDRVDNTTFFNLNMQLYRLQEQ